LKFISKNAHCPRREVEALRAASGHPNVIELLGVYKDGALDRTAPHPWSNAEARSGTDVEIVRHTWVPGRKKDRSNHLVDGSLRSFPHQDSWS